MLANFLFMCCLVIHADVYFEVNPIKMFLVVVILMICVIPIISIIPLMSFQDFHRPSPYQIPESISPFRSTFVSQRSVESPTANGYNSSRTSYHDYPIAMNYGREDDVEVAQETNSRGMLNHSHFSYMYQII